MKKLMKRIVPLVLIVAMCVCMAAPAFAASTVQGSMKEFPTRGNHDSGYTYYGGYVGLIQRIMCAYSSTTYNELTYNNGYIDEDFGSRTTSAVIAFQSAVGLNGNDADGVVGPKTWGKIADRVKFYRTTSTGYKQFAVSGFVVMSLSYVTESNGSYYPSNSSNWYYYIYTGRNNDYIYYNASFEKFI